MYLLDSNACVHILNNSSQPLVARLRAHDRGAIYLSSVVKAELAYGAYHSTRVADNLRLLRRFFDAFESLSFDDHCVDPYGRIRSDLARSGTPIGPNDTMIAAIAVAHEMTLVTNNTHEFSRVVGLQIEDWSAE
jgi:tRNA(fMet)-specific endonuclease VapC